MEYFLCGELFEIGNRGEVIYIIIVISFDLLLGLFNMILNNGV